MPDQRLKLTVAYVGTDFRGWARQPGERTVEGELRSALATLYESVNGLAVAGRTDTGVHALANVVSVDVAGGPQAERAAEALNTVLPADLAVITAEQASGRLPRPLQRASRARIATASGAAASARRSSTTGRSGIRGRSTSTA